MTVLEGVPHARCQTQAARASIVQNKVLGTGHPGIKCCLPAYAAMGHWITHTALFYNGDGGGETDLEGHCSD